MQGCVQHVERGRDEGDAPAITATAVSSHEERQHLEQGLGIIGWN